MIEGSTSSSSACDGVILTSIEGKGSEGRPAYSY